MQLWIHAGVWEPSWHPLWFMTVGLSFLTHSLNFLIWSHVDWHLVWPEWTLKKLTSCHKIKLKQEISYHCYGNTQSLQLQSTSWVWVYMCSVLMCVTQIRGDRTQCHFQLHLLVSDIGELVLCCWDAKWWYEQYSGSRFAINQNADSI